MDYDCANVTQVWMAFWGAGMLAILAMFGMWYYSSERDFWRGECTAQKKSTHDLAIACDALRTDNAAMIKLVRESCNARAVLIANLQDIQSQLETEKWAANEAGRGENNA